MDTVYLIMIKMSYVILGLIFLKSVRTKVKKPFAYYMAMKDYQIVKKEKSLNVITSLLIALELFLALLLITTIYSNIVLIIGLIIQVFYILLIVININKEFINNCGCFSLNMPKKVTTKNLAVNIILLLSIVLIYGCEIRLL
ncbi:MULTISPECIES: MauE/DoxX family redox-associated membrane protein [Bacillus]|jgi:hypothetical protein|uniref:Methylamine utilisation protein MauE domain-containing protein n=5 Tax=Bacillus cereus group TaxID=86661 RepID=A0A9X8J582_BACCE|nr:MULTISPECIES: MauE/DoxX family redox-associated membrane protein [Bacillus cereus group]ANC18179.1 hypothetical protein WR52_05265 [Bacillus cereus]EJR71944.1 hypothetical protein IK5_02842 [Bacillus cereus VD154]KIU70689.1 hypothetical protein C797_27893 [Bacillus thuringiensis Sbt003]MCI4056584.1 hypothetical protein [Bacillus cereus]MDA2478190.1 hypothetical protein [Bacillus cereus]